MPVLDAAWHQSLTNIKMQIPITRDSLKGTRIMTTVFSLSRESIADVTAALSTPSNLTARFRFSAHLSAEEDLRNMLSRRQLQGFVSLQATTRRRLEILDFGQRRTEIPRAFISIEFPVVGPAIIGATPIV
jgi:hypothetical protein